MPAVIKKTKSKSAKKTLPVKSEKKFISESLQKRKLKPGQLKKKTPKHRRRGVVYIKHLPHGFYEEQLRGYFSQFGAITRLRLARSPKTLGSKGYAFIEFRFPEVAEIAAEAMNNYLMFKQIIKTVFIPPSDIKHDYFRSGVKKIKKDGTKMLTSKTIQAREAVVHNTNRLMTDNDVEKRTVRVGAKIQKAKQRLSALGITFDVDEIAQNMGTEVMEAAEKAKPKTLDNLTLESEDEADETFDPSALDIESDDEFEDFEYDSDHTDDDDETDVNIEGEKLNNAIRVARDASKKATIETAKTTGKRKEAAEPEVTSKKTKKGKENKTVAAPVPVAKKAGKKTVAEPKKTVAEPAKVVPIATKKSARKQAAVEKEAEEVEIVAIASKKAPAPVTSKKTPAPVTTKKAPAEKSKPAKEKKVAAPTVKKPESPVIKAKPGKKAPAPAKALAKAPTAPVPESSPKQKAVKGKKAPPAPIEKSTRAKRNVAPPQESPVVVKTKKLAKASAGIEKKKKPAVNEKKLKLVASAVVSSDVAELVKVVKGKEAKGKKKAAKK